MEFEQCRARAGAESATPAPNQNAQPQPFCLKVTPKPPKGWPPHTPLAQPAILCAGFIFLLPSFFMFY